MVNIGDFVWAAYSNLDGSDTKYLGTIEAIDRDYFTLANIRVYINFKDYWLIPGNITIHKANYERHANEIEQLLYK